MSLRGKFVAYLVLIHVVFAAVSVLLLWERGVWLVALEGFFLLSFIAGFWLLRALFRPVDLLRTALDFLRAHDFSTRLIKSGQPDLDPLIDVYNRMAEGLRQARIHNEEQEQFLQRVIAASPSGVLTLDLDGKVSMTNPSAEAMLGRAGDELLGLRLDELGSPLADQLDEIAPEESRLVSVQGRRRIRCRALTFMDRGFARRFVIMDELTEDLHRSEKAAYEKLIRMMSHEVNNTAGAVGSLLESCLAYQNQLAPEDRADFANALGVAISRTGRMNRFMQEFAEVVRLPPPRKRATEIVPLIEETARLLKEESDERRVRWRWETDGEIPPVDLDPGQIEQALINICKNGLEAIGTDGTITVRSGLDRGRPYVVIRDDGGGIAEETRTHLFTPFFTSKRDGQGIGLTMVQEILLAHGFDFSLESDASGKTSFSILF